MTKLDPRAFPDLIRRPLITEKATRLLEENKYSFEVVSKATKPQIKNAIQELFDVKVVAVNTYNPLRKNGASANLPDIAPQYKRAVVTLAEGDSITLFPEV